MGRRGRSKNLRRELGEYESVDEGKPGGRCRGLMTEDQWLACIDSGAFVCSGLLPPHLASWGGARKSRLIACGWCRLHSAELPDERSRRVVDAGEAYAEGLISETELLAAYLAAEGATRQGIEGHWRTVAWANSCAHPLDSSAWVSAVAYSDHDKTDRAAIAALIQEISGNPFCPVMLAPSHRTPTIVSLARAVYDERQLPSGELDPHRLAVLADSLEEIGAPPELVAHLRGPGPHVRGCLAVDLCLGLS